MTFGGRRPSVEDKLQWKTTFGERQPLVEDNLWWKTTFGGRRLSVEDNLQWKTTYGGRLPSVEDNLRWILACCLLCFAAFFFHKDLLLGICFLDFLMCYVKSNVVENIRF